MTRTTFGLAMGLMGCLAVAAEAAKFEVQQEPDGVTVKLDGKLLTRYVIKSGAKPILWPIIGPYGDAVTRQYPMGEALPDEKSDHPHQRSFWFTHGDVNGVSFWMEGETRRANRSQGVLEGCRRRHGGHFDAERMDCTGRQEDVRRRADADLRHLRRERLDRLRQHGDGDRRASQIRRHEGGLLRRARGRQHDASTRRRAARSSTATG